MNSDHTCLQLAAFEKLLREKDMTSCVSSWTYVPVENNGAKTMHLMIRTTKDLTAKEKDVLLAFDASILIERAESIPADPGAHDKIPHQAFC